MTNPEIAAVFREIADLLEFQGANTFRIRAYRSAAQTVEDWPDSLAAMVGQPGCDFAQIKGIGKDLAEKIETLLETGTIAQLDDLRAEIPESVLAMLRVPGLGPKKAAALFHELKITNLEELREACEKHKVQVLKGFGAKTEARILQGAEMAEQVAGRMLWAEADTIVHSLVAGMREQSQSLRRIEAAGSYRRRRETIGDLDLLAVSDDPDEVMDCFARLAHVDEVLLRGETKMSIRQRHTQFQIDLRVVPAASFGAALQYFTGSKAHNVELRRRAKRRGLKINEYGVFRNEKQIAGAEEEEVYAAIDLPWFPPELREARWEFEWADDGRLPRLLELADIRGDLHMHSRATDGRNSIEEMALAAKQRGREYIAITDHSQYVRIANGLNAKKILREWEDIDRVNKKLRGITVFKGVEVDILPQGGLDLPDEVLAKADWVVASIHFGQQQSREQITGRIIDALSNPYVCVIGHPTGRLLNERPAYDVDIEAVMQVAKREGKCLELNSSPHRLDLDDVACGAAKRLGVPIVVSTDAHYDGGLDAMRYGVYQARRGGLAAADVLNTRSLADFRKSIKRIRG